MIYTYFNNEIIMNIMKNITRIKTIQILKILKYQLTFKNDKKKVVEDLALNIYIALPYYDKSKLYKSINDDNTNNYDLFLILNFLYELPIIDLKRILNYQIQKGGGNSHKYYNNIINTLEISLKNNNFKLLNKLYNTFQIVKAMLMDYTLFELISNKGNEKDITVDDDLLYYRSYELLFILLLKVDKKYIKELINTINGYLKDFIFSDKDYVEPIYPEQKIKDIKGLKILKKIIIAHRDKKITNKIVKDIEYIKQNYYILNIVYVYIKIFNNNYDYIINKIDNNIRKLR